MTLRTALAFATALVVISLASAAYAQEVQIDTLHDLFARLGKCFQPPRVGVAIDITVLMSFRRDGSILGRPRVTYETDDASDDVRLAYRVAAMQALQRCTPMPFTEALGNAVAGRTLRMRFNTRQKKPEPVEKRAWLTPTIL